MIMRVLAGAAHPYAGTVTQNGEICYLPQDPKEVDLNTLARNRVLSARGMDRLLADLEKQRALMAEAADDIARDRALGRYGQLEEQFASVGGYAAESEALRICANLDLPEVPSTGRLDPVRRRTEAGRDRAGPFRCFQDRRRACHHPVARRADQPSRRRLVALAA